MSALAFEPATLIAPSSSMVRYAASQLIDKLSNDELFEDGEMKPSNDVILSAARTVPFDSLEVAEVSPFFGELNLTWRHDRKRVKAIFGPAPERFAVYWEEMQDGTVVHHNIEAEATAHALFDLISWVSE